MSAQIYTSMAKSVYPFADVHLNATICPDPWKFDPERPHPKGNLAYLGRGGGASFLLRFHTRCWLELNLTMFLLLYIPFILGIITWDRERDPRFAISETTDQASRGAASHGLRL
jgi:hypothetical protein